MLHRRALLVALVEMQLQVADAEPAHRRAEVRRRELLEPEELLVPQRRPVGVAGRDADMRVSEGHWTPLLERSWNLSQCRLEFEPEQDLGRLATRRLATRPCPYAPPA